MLPLSSYVLLCWVLLINLGFSEITGGDHAEIDFRPMFPYFSVGFYFFNVIFSFIYVIQRRSEFHRRTRVKLVLR